MGHERRQPFGIRFFYYISCTAKHRGRFNGATKNTAYSTGTGAAQHSTAHGSRNRGGGRADTTVVSYRTTARVAQQQSAACTISMHRSRERFGIIETVDR